MIVVAILGILAAIATPNFRKAREQSRMKACYANQRVLQGAVEMYNMDHPAMMTGLDMPALLKGQYLKSPITPPMMTCEYFASGDLSSTGFVYCKGCGGVDQDIDKILNMAGVHSPTHVQTSAPSGSPGAPEPRKGFSGGRTKGALSLETKFVLTSNFYSLTRDLVLADQAGDGALTRNTTCPTVRFGFMRWEILQGMKITEIGRASCRERV